MMRRDVSETRADQPQLGALSARELDVLRLLARGLENNQIAGELGISPRTAKNHVSSVLAKLGVSSRVQAAIFAVRQGIS
jgi:DNA-binding NarL/FixJ family response regulator